jgi:hypothetical protein
MNKQQKSIYKKVSICFILLSLGLMSVSIACAETYTLDEQWNITEYITGSDDVAIDSSGNIYVAVYDSYSVNYNPYDVMKFDSSGNFIMNYGSDEEELDSVNAVAVDSSGNVYASYNGRRILKFDSSGNIIMDIDATTVEIDDTGTTLQVRDLAADSSGNIYATSDRQSICKFDGSGNFIPDCGEWYMLDNGEGLGKGLLVDSSIIEVDSSDNIYTFSGSDRAVLKFDSDCNLLTQWNCTEERCYLFVDQSDNVHVMSSTIGSPNIYTYDTNGNLLTMQDIDTGSQKKFVFDSSRNVWYFYGLGAIEKYASVTQDSEQIKDTEQVETSNDVTEQTQTSSVESDDSVAETEAASTEDTDDKESPGFGIICGIVCLFAAVLYNKR